MPKRKAEPQASIASEIEAMKLIGMTDEQIRETILKRNNPLMTVPAGAVVSADAMKPGNFARVEAPLTAPQQQDKNGLGPDPEVVARQQKFLETYVPPILERVYEVILPVRRAEYIERACAYENAVRAAQAQKRNAPPPKEITPGQMIALIVGKYWQNDPDRALHQGGIGTGTSMQRTNFNPPAAGEVPAGHPMAQG